MKRPLWRVALLYVMGVLLANWITAPLAGLFLGATLLAVLALSGHRVRGWLLVPLLILLGWVNLAWRTAVLSPHDLRRLLGERTDLVSLRGRLIEPPTQSVFDRAGEETWRTQARIAVEALAHGTNWEPAFGRVAVTTPGVLGEAFFTGRRVEVYGVLGPPRGALAEGLFDYRAYLRWQDIHYQLQTKSTNDWRRLASSANAARPGIAERFWRWAQLTLRRGLPVEDESLRLNWAMALGWKTALTDEVSAPFMQTGTMHIFAISGLHIALIAGILVTLLRVLQVPRGACGWVAIPLIWFYTAATGWQPSAVRSTIMMTVVIVGWSLHRPGDLLNSLGAAGFIILLWDPSQLFQASFQLSFFVVLSIALFLAPIEQWLQRLLQPDPLLPPELRPRWQRWLDRPLRWLALSFATSLASWLGSLPLTAWYFHLFTPVSLAANLVVVPLSGFALMCHLASVLCGDWLPGLTELFNHAGWLWMRWMVSASDWFARWPGAFWHIRTPTLLEVSVYYGLLLLAFSGWLLAMERRRWTLPAAGALVGAVLLAGWLPGRGEVHMTILPLGGGEAIWVNAPGRAHDVLIDSGNASSARLTVEPFLRAQGVNHLPQFFLTHGDVRNIGGAPSILETFRVGQITTSAFRFRSAAYRQFVEQLEREHRPWRQVRRGDQVGPWSVLHPMPDDRFPLADDGALVLRGELNGVRVLLLSDLGKAGQYKLLERAGDLAADIVVAGLPHQSGPLIAPLLAAIQPRLVIVTDSEFPATERAGQPLRDRLKQSGVPVVFTSRSGAVTLRFKSDRCELAARDGTKFADALNGNGSRMARATVETD